jgi:hypothetical protein
MQITVAPVGNGRYSASIAGRVLCASSRVPFLDAARVLKAEGVSEDTTLEMIFCGVPSLEAKLGVAAALTVQENEKAGPRLIPFREFKGFRAAAEPDDLREAA